jgi:hypothetical protein
MSNREIEGGCPYAVPHHGLPRPLGLCPFSGYRCISEEGACSEHAEKRTPRPFEPGCAAFIFFSLPLTFRDNYFLLSMDRFWPFYDASSGRFGVRVGQLD